MANKEQQAKPPQPSKPAPGNQQDMRGDNKSGGAPANAMHQRLTQAYKTKGDSDARK